MTSFPVTRAARHIQSLRKSGQPRQAIELGMSSLRETPQDHALKRMIGWAIYDEVKAKVAQFRPAQRQNAARCANDVANLMRQFAATRPTLPELSYSLMLTQVLKLKDHAIFLPKMLQWATLEGLRDADYLPPPSAGRNRAIPSLAERAALLAIKIELSKKMPSRDTLYFLLQLVNSVRERADNLTDWLSYREAQALTALGEHTKAKALLRRFVQQHGDKFWAWHALSASVADTNPELALQMLFHAAQQAPGAFGVSVLDELRESAVQQERYDIAAWAARREAALRDKQGWRRPPALARSLDSTWLQNALQLNLSDYRAQAMSASRQFLLGKQDRLRATFLGVTTSPAGYKQGVFAILQANGSVHGASAALTELRGWEQCALKPGDAAWAVGASDGQCWMLLEVEADPLRPTWQFSTLYQGAIEHQNPRKKVTWIALERGAGTGTYWQDQPELSTLAPGTPVQLLGVTERLYHPDGRLMDFIHIVKSGIAPNSRLVQNVEGDIEFPQGKRFAWLKHPSLPKGRAYIPPQIAQTLRKNSPRRAYGITMPGRRQRGNKERQVVRILETTPKQAEAVFHAEETQP